MDGVAVKNIHNQAETKQNYNGYGPYFHHLFVFQYPIRTGLESKLGRGIANEKYSSNQFKKKGNYSDW
jgi:hypothetical protein